MKKISFLFIYAYYLVMTSCMTKETKPAAEEVNIAKQVERGGYLVNAIGCDDCHSPKNVGPQGFEIIEELRFSGYPANNPLKPVDKENLKNGWILFADDLTSAVGPWGQSFAANISSDATGIGNWTEENFITALRKGKHKGIESARSLLPPMPWFVYKNLSDEDLKAIFAYLKSTKPVKNIVPQPIPFSELK
jgi:hypothetical protein